MRGRCFVCTHPQRTEIEAELIGGASIYSTAKKYGFSYPSIWNHYKRHMVGMAAKQVLQTGTIEARIIDDGTSVLNQVRELNREARSILREARDKDRTKDALLAINSILRILEFEARLLGELDRDRPQMQINVLASPEWLQIKERIINALSPYPEAANAVALALMEANNGNESSQ